MWVMYELKRNHGNLIFINLDSCQQTTMPCVKKKKKKNTTLFKGYD